MRFSYGFLCLIVLSLALSSLPVFAFYNLLQNPGFETGSLYPWDGDSGGSGGYGIVSPGHTGAYAASMGGGNGGAGIWQYIYPPRCAIFLEFWYSGHNGGCTISYSDGTTQSIPLPSTGNWTKFFIELDSTKLVYRVEVGSGNGGIYVDDFYLESCEPPVGGEILPSNLSTITTWLIVGVSTIALSAGIVLKKKNLM
jgi:hypothetical protein